MSRIRLFSSGVGVSIGDVVGEGVTVGERVGVCAGIGVAVEVAIFFFPRIYPTRHVIHDEAMLGECATCRSTFII